jgi:hypothetical protein
MDGSTLFDQVKGILGKAFWVLGLGGGIMIVGDFSPRQAYTLGLALMIVYWPALGERPNKMTPFAVSIRPNWYELLKDHGLVDEQK